MCIPGQASVLLPQTQLLATDNGGAPYYQHAPRGGCCLGGGRHLPVHRVLGSEPRRLRTHSHTQIATNLQETTGHVSGPAQPNVTWGTKFPAVTSS